MSDATDTPDLPRYSWTKDELRTMTMGELAENLARVVQRIGEISFHLNGSTRDSVDKRGQNLGGCPAAVAF